MRHGVGLDGSNKKIYSLKKLFYKTIYRVQRVTIPPGYLISSTDHVTRLCYYHLDCGLTVPMWWGRGVQSGLEDFYQNVGKIPLLNFKEKRGASKISINHVGTFPYRYISYDVHIQLDILLQPCFVN